MVLITWFILTAVMSPRLIWAAAECGTTTTSRGGNRPSSSHRYRIHHSHMFHMEPRAIIDSVISDVRRQTHTKNSGESSLLDIDVSSNKLGDSESLFLMEELVSLFRLKVDQSLNLESEKKNPPPASIKLSLAMNKLTPSGASRLFEAMKNETENLSENENKADDGECEMSNVIQSESDTVLANDSLKLSTNAGIDGMNDKTKDDESTKDASSDGGVSTNTPQDETTHHSFLQELDLSFNDIGGQGNHSPNVELLDSVRRLFEGDGTALFVPRILVLENCGIGPAFCRQVGRGILNAFERKHDGARNMRYRPSVLRMGGNSAIGDAGTVALAAALRMAMQNDDDKSNVMNELDLSSCCVGDAGAEALALALSSNPGCLLRLDLSNNKITDVGSKTLGRALVDASHSSGVVFDQIILDNNADIGDAGAAALAEAMAVGAVKTISIRSCSVKAEGAAAFGKALTVLANRKHGDESSHFHIDLSGNHFGTRRIKKKKGKASLIRDKASTNIKFIGKTLTSAAKRFGSETMGITADSDDDEEVMGGLIEEEEEEDTFGDKLQSCGGLALAGEILRSDKNSSSHKKEGTRCLKISIGMCQCCLDDGAVHALSASIVGAKKWDMSIDVSMNSMDEDVVDALKCPKKHSKSLLISMAQRHMDFMDRIADARQRQLEAAESISGIYFDNDDDDYDPYDFD